TRSIEGTRVSADDGEGGGGAGSIAGPALATAAAGRFLAAMRRRFATFFRFIVTGSLARQRRISGTRRLARPSSLRRPPATHQYSVTHDERCRRRGQEHHRENGTVYPSSWRVFVFLDRLAWAPRAL